jgi:predicted phage terminase large subunit-like protein
MSLQQRKEDQKAYQSWLQLCGHIKEATKVEHEDADKAAKRKKDLRKDWVKFSKYYFPHYLDSDFGWFHKRAAKDITARDNVFAILEWPREHAKSVFANVFMALYLYARGEISGMVVVSANADKAKTLLGDLQAEFVSNDRWIKDYGDLAKMGNWQDGQFTTTDGVGFWALGRGQSPRGIRQAANRPNYAVIDDIDDKVISRNPKRVKEAVDWIMEDLYGALSIKGSRLIVAGNRINKNSILANLVGDVEPKDPKRPGIYHLKVYAFEKGTRHAKGDPDDPDSKPAWKRYTRKMLKDKMEVMGYRAARREYFHEHHEEGNVFKREMITYGKVRKRDQYTRIVTYCDPSWKDNGDFKAIITVGSRAGRTDILDIWLRKASTGAMIGHFYDVYEVYENYSMYYMEANFMQDLILDEFTAEGEARNHQLPIRGDKRAKPNKEVRIENMEPLWERGLIKINERLRDTPDCQEFVSQLLGFPYGHDDGPDALEGGLFYTQRATRAAAFTPRSGNYTRSSKYD